VTTSLKCGYQQAYYSSPRWFMSMDKHCGMMMSTEVNSWFVHQSSLTVLLAESFGSKEWEFGLVKYLCSYLQVIFLHAVKSYDTGPWALLPLWRNIYCGFSLPLKIMILAGFEHVNLGSNGKHTNHYFAKETRLLTKLSSTVLLCLVILLYVAHHGAN
jgi:vacuolar-type H+-ATPase subunit I/STV1